MGSEGNFRAPRLHVRRDHVDRALEETGNMLLEADVIVDRPFGPRLELHQDVDVAVRMGVAARQRPKDSGMRDSLRAQRAFVAAKGGDGIASINVSALVAILPLS